MSKRDRICHYTSETQDFVFSREQDHCLPQEYQWIPDSALWRLGSGVFYEIARVFSWIFCGIHLHTRVKNRKVLRTCQDEGIFVYGNHTQPVADAFAPAIVLWPRRIYTVVSPANLGIPVLGRLLPMLGALPIPDQMRQMKAFTEAVRERIAQKHCVIIYPEAHVWPYCTMIRDFPSTAFHYPVDCHAPCYAMTTTYQRRRWSKKPRATVYLDGPFYPDTTLRKKEQREKLRDEVYAAMKARSCQSTYAYIQYIKEE